MECYFKKEGNVFSLGNQNIERVWEYNGHYLYTTSIVNKATGHQWVHKLDNVPGFFYEGLTGRMNNEYKSYEFELLDVCEYEVKNSLYSCPYLEVIFYMKNSLHDLEVKQHALIYEDTQAIRTYLEVRSQNMPSGNFFSNLRFNILDTYQIPVKDGKLSSYEFFTRTDFTNHLIEAREQQHGFDNGNLLLYYNNDSNGFFIMKESPCFSDLRPETAGNFYVDKDKIQVLGWGIRPEEVPSEGFKKTYSSIIGVFNEGFEYGLMALKKYQKARAMLKPERDYMVMANPWGDRQCMEHLNEGFVLRELETCARVGITHYQMDAGWSKGDGVANFINNESLNEDFWDIDQERFPNGFNLIAEKARESNVELGLWFAPDSNKLFKDYKKYADFLYEMYIQNNIKNFKIDCTQLRNKDAEDNLEKFLIRLKEMTKGEICFNLDTTADARAGYFMFQEYGNIFLENRYTDWSNYYPYLTLRNLWDLSSFVPPQKLQIEFLNIDRNADKYDKEDVLAPYNYSYEYIFAITMFSNPLCWFETSGLGEEAVISYRRMILLHIKYRNEIFEAHIFPIGQRPSGYSWTGFQSHNPDINKGYIIIYREYNPRCSFCYKPMFMKGKNIYLHSLSDNSSDITINEYDESGIEISMGSVNSFRLYHYVLT